MENLSHLIHTKMFPFMEEMIKTGTIDVMVGCLVRNGIQKPVEIKINNEIRMKIASVIFRNINKWKTLAI